MHSVFSHTANPNPLESLERRPSEMRKNNFDRKFSSFPAKRERRSTPGAAPPGRIGGRMARRNRRVEPEGRIGRVRPSSPMAHGMADWRRRAGERERRNGPARSSAWFFVCFFFWGASAGRGRRTSGVDGADIGCRSRHVKEKYRKKGNNYERPSRRSPPYGVRRAAGMEARRIPLRKGHWPAARLPLPPRTERSGDPGSRGTRRGRAGRLWAPDRVRGGNSGCLSTQRETGRKGQALVPGSSPRGVRRGRDGGARGIALPALNCFRAAFRRGILKRGRIDKSVPPQNFPRSRRQS